MKNKKEEVCESQQIDYFTQIYNLILHVTQTDYVKWANYSHHQECSYRNKCVKYYVGTRQLSIDGHIFYLNDKQNSFISFFILKNIEKQEKIINEQLAKQVLESLTNDTGNRTT